MAEAKKVGHIFLSNKSLLASQLLLNLQTSTNQDKTDSLKLFVCIVHSYVDTVSAYSWKLCNVHLHSPQLRGHSVCAFVETVRLHSPQLRRHGVCVFVETVHLHSPQLHGHGVSVFADIDITLKV